MSKTRPPYPAEFRRQIVELARVGRSVEELAREFEPSARSIRTWIVQVDREEGRAAPKPAAVAAAVGVALSAAERDELARLRREVCQLRVERDILSRAAAVKRIRLTARETGTIPSPVSFASGGACRADDIPPGDRKRWSSGS